MIARPPYRVPLMAEINALPWNGLTVASTFSGCGGSCLGYRMAGFKVGWANEFLPAAQESYRANMAPDGFLDDRDIKKVRAEDIMGQLGIRQGELDVFDGSPPCQAFSTAGQREKGWGKDRKYENGASQRNEVLFWEYIRILQGLKPKMFVAENVAGLVKGTAKGFFLEILRDLKASGYRVEARVIDAQWLGVPQTRARLVFVGTREDLPISPSHPLPLGYRYTVRDALPWVDQVINDTSGQHSAGDVTDKPVNAILTGSSNHFKVRGAIPFAPSSPGLQVHEDPRPLSDRVVASKWSKQLGDAGVDHNLPAPAVMARGMGGVGHGQFGIRVSGSADMPSPVRKFTIAEVKRLSGFPDDFILKGSYAQQWERLGNSVPPVMMSHVAAGIRDQLLTLRR